MRWWQRLLTVPALAGVFVLGALVGAGLTSGVIGYGNPVLASVPVIGAKPDRGRVQQPGQGDCDTTPNGYSSDEGCPVAVGKGFVIGYHTVIDGWTLVKGPRGPVLTMTVWNNNPGAITGFWHTVHLERYDDSLVEIVWCETGPFAADEYRKITCEPLMPEGWKPFDKVAILY